MTRARRCHPILSSRKHDSLVLESTFTSLTDVARMRFPFLPPERILQHRFDSLAKARSLTLPVMVIHGTADETIPFEMGERLFAAIASTRKKLLLIANGGHSSSGAVETLPLLMQVSSRAIGPDRLRLKDKNLNSA